MAELWVTFDMDAIAVKHKVYILCNQNEKTRSKLSLVKQQRNCHINCDPNRIGMSKINQIVCIVNWHQNTYISFV